jgi:hypothetical protein
MVDEGRRRLLVQVRRRSSACLLSFNHTSSIQTQRTKVRLEQCI